ncbi:MAG: hypothetical protein EOO85_24305 [Pedobacter sp.]|nr:MAG: hypothetical protein EOO85_24305 [Pedobacter sp.]
MTTSFFLFACSRQSKLEKKLVDISKTEYWKVLKWNRDDYINDTLLLRFYANNKYDFFRFNKKKGIVVSLTPDSSSDIVAYQYWAVKEDSLLSFRKRVDFIFSFNRSDTMWFTNMKDSLIIVPFSLVAINN